MIDLNNIINEKLNNKEIVFHMGLCKEVVVMYSLSVILLILSYVSKEVKLVPIAVALALYHINVILHEITHWLVHTIYGKFQGYIYICSKESEKTINVKGSCVYNTRKYRYTKLQMIFMLLAPTIVSSLLVFISIKITSRLIVDIKGYEMAAYFIILVLTYISGGISDIGQALSTVGKKSKYVREYIDSQGKFYIDVS